MPIVTSYSLGESSLMLSLKIKRMLDFWLYNYCLLIYLRFNSKFSFSGIGLLEHAMHTYLAQFLFLSSDTKTVLQQINPGCLSVIWPYCSDATGKCVQVLETEVTISSDGIISPNFLIILTLYLWSVSTFTHPIWSRKICFVQRAGSIHPRIRRSAFTCKYTCTYMSQNRVYRISSPHKKYFRDRPVKLNSPRLRIHRPIPNNQLGKNGLVTTFSRSVTLVGIRERLFND